MSKRPPRKVVVFESAGRFGWRLETANGNVVAESDGTYERYDEAEKAAKAARRTT